eukprot:COSAG01_NODE_7037_length_3382_cov_2.049345_2_plen_126_part_00
MTLQAELQRRRQAARLDARARARQAERREREKRREACEAGLARMQAGAARELLKMEAVQRQRGAAPSRGLKAGRLCMLRADGRLPLTWGWEGSRLSVSGVFTSFARPMLPEVQLSMFDACWCHAH